MENEDKMCKICNTNPFKYVCPRCNVVYCSVVCYKAVTHSDCSEAFYKECIKEHVTSQEPIKESRNKMLEMLERVNRDDEENIYDEYSSDDSDDVDSINERLAGVDLDDADAVWEKLTEEERQEFIGLVKEGDVTQLLPSWVPWWSKKFPKPKVRFLDDKDEIQPDYETLCPTVSKFIQPLSSITRTKPSDCIFFNLVNILGSYTVMARYYNGEHITMFDEATTILISISKNLCENENFISIETALESVYQEAIACEFMITSDRTKVFMKEDVINILKGPNEENFVYYIQAALSDTYKTMQESKRSHIKLQNKGKFTTIFPEINNSVNKCTKEKISKCMQKIKYYQSWCLEYYKPNIFL